jgi:hypothetical protein
MILQRAPQAVIATYRHPVAGDWLWLDDGQCGFRSWAAAHWTTEEPGEAEKAARTERHQRAAAESAPELPPVRRGSPCPVHGGPLLWSGDGNLTCLEEHSYQIPVPPKIAPGRNPFRRR